MDHKGFQVSEAPEAPGVSKGVNYCGTEFHFGVHETILFGEWRIDSVGGLLWSMVVIAIVTGLYEAIKYYREYLAKKAAGSQQFKSSRLPADKGESCCQGNQVIEQTMWNRHHAYQTFLHGIQFLLSYFVMLVFMIYNVWLCLAVLIGTLVGYFIFGWKKSSAVDVTENCH